MKRTTVDTNVLISATFWRGIPKQVIQTFEIGNAVLVLSDEILAEFERKLHHKKFTNELAEIGLSIEEIVGDVRSMTDLALPVDVPEDAIRDPKDRMILGCAVGGNADVIVSGDKDLLVLKTYQDIPIVTPSAFLDIVNPPAEEPMDDTTSE